MKPIDVLRISTLLLLLLPALIFVGCDNAKEKDFINQEVWLVAPETVMAKPTPSKPEQEMMQVTAEDGKHYTLPLDAIARFEYEPGYSYTLSVLVDYYAKEAYRSNGTLRVTLVKVISKIEVTKDNSE